MGVENEMLCAKNKNRFDLGQTATVNLVFVAGPNSGSAGNPENPKSAALRTYNMFGGGEDGYANFLEGVKHAIRAAFVGAIESRSQIVILAPICTGIYKFPDNYDVVKFLQLANAVLKEEVGSHKFMNYFEAVYLPNVGRPGATGTPIERP